MKHGLLVFVLSFALFAVVSAEVASLTAIETGTTATWANSASPKREKELKGLFLTTSTNDVALAIADEVFKVYVTVDGSDYYVREVGASGTTSAVHRIGFDVPAVVKYGESVKVVRTAASTNTVMKAILVLE